MAKTRFKKSGLYGKSLGLTDAHGNTEEFITASAVNSATIEFPVVKVRAGEALAKGNLVYIDGYNATDGLPVVKKADADATNHEERFAMFICPEAIGNNATGYVKGFAHVTGINTGNQNVGVKLWLSTTSGGFTHTKPAGSGHNHQYVGVVTVKGDGATAGAALFFPMFGHKIGEGTG